VRTKSPEGALYAAHSGTSSTLPREMVFMETLMRPDKWSALTASQPWKRLRIQQQVWVTAFIASGGDSRSAARLAYPKATEKSQTCMSYALPTGIRIAAVLKFWKDLK
jgi:hypothetical protein